MWPMDFISFFFTLNFLLLFNLFFIFCYMLLFVILFNYILLGFQCCMCSSRFFFIPWCAVFLRILSFLFNNPLYNFHFLLNLNYESKYPPISRCLSLFVCITCIEYQFWSREYQYRSQSATNLSLFI